MNVTKKELIFHNTKLSTVRIKGSIWITAADLAIALKYSNTKSITNLYNQNVDEFSLGMSQVIESVTSGNYKKKVRVFSLRGAHLIAMFARTPIAKEFRIWVLNIIDREIINPKQPAAQNLIFTCPECGSRANLIESQYRHRCSTECYIKCTNKHCLTTALLDIQLRQILTYPNKDKVKKTIMSMSKMDRAIALDMLLS